MMTFSNQLPGHFLNNRGFVEADRRTKARSETFKIGTIAYDPDRRVLSVIKNISPTGALLELENAVEIPDEFTLAIDSEPSPRFCRVAWKKAKQVAVNFDAAPLEPTSYHRQEPRPGRQDRRRAPRRGLNTAGWIRLDGSFAIKECKIVDVSTAGVRLCIPFAGKIPETFTVLFSKGAQGHRVRVIWRRANQIGAKFV
jgi:PilZ domain-containing protein